MTTKTKRLEAVLGYARVSTAGQRTDNQVELLEAAGATEVFAEKVSGSRNAHSSTYRDLFDRVRELTDEGYRVTVVVTKLDRFSRSLTDLLHGVQELADLGATFLTLDNSLNYDPDSPASKFQLQVFGALAEFERALINSRTAEGRKAAREKGVKFGHPPKLKQKDVDSIKADHESCRWTPAQIANRNSTSRSTVLRVLGLYGAGPYQTREEWEAEKRAAQRKK